MLIKQSSVILEKYSTSNFEDILAIESQRLENEFYNQNKQNNFYLYLSDCFAVFKCLICQGK